MKWACLVSSNIISINFQTDVNGCITVPLFMPTTYFQAKEIYMLGSTYPDLVSLLATFTDDVTSKLHNVPSGAAMLLLIRLLVVNSVSISTACRTLSIEKLLCIRVFINSLIYVVCSF